MIVYKPLYNGNTCYQENWPFELDNEGNETKALSPSTISKPLSWLVYGYSEKTFKTLGMYTNTKLESAVSVFLNTTDSNEKIKPSQKTGDRKLAFKELFTDAYQSGSMHNKFNECMNYLGQMFKGNFPIKHEIHKIYYTHISCTLVACESDIDFANKI